jgi:single-strand DNA-binding protein
MYQSVTIIGHLGRDPEMRYTSSGVAVTSFSVATSRKWTDAAGAAQEKTTWFRVSAWRKLGEACNQYLHKGQLVMVEGEVDASAYTPKDGGDPKATLEMRATPVKFLGGKGGEEQQEAAPADETDVPF